MLRPILHYMQEELGEVPLGKSVAGAVGETKVKLEEAQDLKGPEMADSKDLDGVGTGMNGYIGHDMKEGKYFA